MKKTITFSVLLITVLSILSKLLGFLRETVVAYYFGTTQEADIFFLVFGLFNFITAAVGISLGCAFLPVFLKIKNEKGAEKADLLAVRFSVQLLFLMLPVIVILYFYSDCFAYLIAPSYSVQSLATVAYYIQVLSVIAYFTVVSYVFFDVLNAYKKYGIRQLTGMLFSVISIVFLYFFAGSAGINALIYSVVVASVIQFVILVIVLFHDKRICVSLNIFSFSGMRETYLSIFPVLLGTGVWYFRNAIDRVIATGLDAGSISALNYSGTLFSLINTLIIASIVTVFYTEFSQQYVDKKLENVSKTLNNGIISLCVLLCPIMIISIIESEDIISILFLRGEFKQESVALTALTFSLYLIGTPFYAMRDILTRFCYSTDNRKIPVRNSLIAVVLNIPLSYMFSRYWGAGGITLASAIVSILLTFLLFIDVKNNNSFLNFSILRNSLIKIFLSTLLCIFLGYILRIHLNVELGRFVRLLIISCVVFISYFAFLYLLRLKELAFVFEKIKKK